MRRLVRAGGVTPHTAEREEDTGGASLSSGHRLSVA